MNDDYTTDKTDSMTSNKTRKKYVNALKKNILTLLKAVIIMLTLPLMGIIIYKIHEWIIENAAMIGSITSGIILGSFMSYIAYQYMVHDDNYAKKRNWLLLTILLIIIAYMVVFFNLNILIMFFVFMGALFVGSFIAGGIVDYKDYKKRGLL